MKDATGSSTVNAIWTFLKLQSRGPERRDPRDRMERAEAEAVDRTRSLGLGGHGKELRLDVKCHRNSLKDVKHKNGKI